MNSCESQQGNLARLAREYDIEAGAGQGARGISKPQVRRSVFHE